MTSTHTLWVSPFGDLHLRPWPVVDGDALRAWDGADRLAASMLADVGCPQQVWVLNDQWGAITALVLAAGGSAQVTLDSACSAQALEQNLNRSGLDLLRVKTLIPGEPPVISPDAIILRVPRIASQLASQLAEINRFCPKGTPVWLLAMDKHMPRTLLRKCSQQLEQVHFMPGRYKAHCLVGISRAAEGAGQLSRPWACYQLPEHDLVLGALPGVFSGDKPDPGGRYLSSFLSGAEGEMVADLGCGNGLLGLALARLGMPAELWFCDESRVAIESARQNAVRNFGDSLVARYHHGHALEGVPDGLDLVLLNPPFHRGNAVDTLTGSQMIESAAVHLRHGGRLLMVANRHLDYRAPLRRRFRQWKQIGENEKFRVISALR